MTIINQMMLAAMAGGSTAEQVSLSGTSGSPRTATAVELDIANVIWLFGVDDRVFGSIVKGQVQSSAFSDGDPGNSYTSVDTATDWVIPNDFQNGPYYIRGTLEAGQVPNWPGNSPLNTWIALTNGSTDVSWGWRQASIGTRDGTIKVEIATDSGGSNIVATGYYRGVAIYS